MNEINTTNQVVATEKIFQILEEHQIIGIEAIGLFEVIKFHILNK